MQWILIPNIYLRNTIRSTSVNENTTKKELAAAVIQKRTID